VITVVAAVITLVGAVLLMRSAARAKPDAARYARRGAPQCEEPAVATSERAIWEALDDGRDPTDPDNKGR
jgi:uncharacterized membrane protein (TIGR02234 family)